MLNSFQYQKQTIMIQTYLKIAWRTLLKNKWYSAINIGGLAIGMTCFLMIAMFIKNELSYDTYHEKGDQIYRVVHHNSADNSEDKWIWGNAPVGPALEADFPEVLETVRFSGRADVLLEYNNKKYQEGNCFYVDDTVFDVFSWPLTSGNPETALGSPYSVVLTESTAKKYFGSEDPMGKTLDGFGGRAADGIYTVTGIMKDVPENSHFSFDALFSMASFYQTRPGIFDAWGYVDFYTYFLMDRNFDQAAFQAKMPDFLTRNRPADEMEYFYNLSFEPIKDAYLLSSAERQPGVTGSLSNIYIFSLIGLFILVIASINFMNLATARSLERAKEVGVRKVIGADKGNLVRQFLGESLLMVLLSAALGFLLAIACLRGMGQITGKHFSIADITDTQTLLLYFGTALFTGLLAGCYPAFVLSSFKPVHVLKGIFRTSQKGTNLRKGLVIFQFSLSIALIAGTLVVYFQLGHMLNQNLGFDREQQLVIDYNFDGDVNNRLETVKSEFESLPDVNSVAASRTVPGGHFPAAGTNVETASGEMELFEPFIYEVDVDFIPHYNLEMAAGRGYSRDFPADTISSMVINEAAAKSFGYSNPSDILGKKFEQWGKEGVIVGVVKDFNYLSLHQKVAPLTLRYEPFASRYLSIKMQSENLPKTIADIEQKWAALAPHRPFLYSFLDTSFNEQYKADIKFRQLFTIFSCLAILIACLGLLGLATYSAIQRTKEIGIRKVLGAEVGSIVRLLSIDFLKLVGIAILVATPFAWFAMSKWLDGFAYRMDMNIWVFALAGGIALLIAIATMSFHAVKAANRNPIKSLRTE